MISLDQGESTWRIELKLDRCRTCHNLELGCKGNYSSWQIHGAERFMKDMVESLYLLSL